MPSRKLDWKGKSGDTGDEWVSGNRGVNSRCDRRMVSIAGVGSGNLIYELRSMRGGLNLRAKSGWR